MKKISRIIYFNKKRLKELVRSVANKEELSDIRISKPGVERLQSSLKFLTLVMTYEIIQLLKNNKRKTISRDYVDMALTNIIQRSDVLNTTLNKLEDLTKQLESLNTDTSMTKALDFINLGESNGGDGE